MVGTIGKGRRSSTRESEIPFAGEVELDRLSLACIEDRIVDEDFINGSVEGRSANISRISTSTDI